MASYTVNIVWDEEAQVWIALSDDIPGLALESDSLDKLQTEIPAAVNELLEFSDSHHVQFAVSMQASRQYVYA